MGTLAGLRHIYIYIYICCRVKTWSKNSLFWVKTWSKFSLFFLFCFSKIFFFLQGQWDFKEKRAKKRQKTHHFLSQNLVQFCCATYLDQVLTQPWTKFWFNIFANFWVFLPVWKDTETTIFIVFQRRRNDNINKICVLEGVGEGEILRKIVQNAVFSWEFHDNKIWKFCEFYCQKFCCHLGGS